MVLALLVLPEDVSEAALLLWPEAGVLLVPPGRAFRVRPTPTPRLLCAIFGACCGQELLSKSDILVREEC